MAPVFINEFLSRRQYYLEHLKKEAGLDIKGKSDEEILAMLQDYRISQYAKLTDEVYEEKGYDRNGIPLDETLVRLGFDGEDYFKIVRNARDRLENHHERNVIDLSIKELKRSRQQVEASGE